MKFFLYCLFLSFVTSLDAEEVDAEWLSIHQVEAENIDPFYKDLRSSHQYVLGLTQIIDTLSFNDYSVRFYVDTTEMSLTYARDKMCRFSRLEFYHQSTKLATFDNDDCFTCLGLKDNAPIMFKAHKIGEDLALVMRGEEYSDDLPEFCIFLIHNQQVSLIYNKENAILDTKFQENKTIYHCLSMLGVNETGEEPQYCDIIFEDDKISVFSTKTNSEKMIYAVPENSSDCVVRPIDNAFSEASNLVKPFYCSEREHSFVLEKSQSVKAGKSRDAIIRWYRDEKEWEVQDSTYSKIEILQDDSLLAGYINDNGWVKLSEYPMNDSVTVLLLEERTYSAGSPSLCLLKLENRSVSVLYNQEQFINHIAEKAGSLELTLFGFVHDYRHYKLNASHPILMGPHVKMNIYRNGIKLFDSEGHETSISLQHPN